VRSLLAAAQNDDIEQLEAIFGLESSEILSSGDQVADRHDREVFVVAMDQGWTLENTDDQTRELIVGHEQWPFPIPIRKDSHGWWFDTQGGKHEVLARRIGRNELAAIGVLRTYVVSQLEYASTGHDGLPAGIYAQHVKSDPGRHNGLYWPVNHPGESASPLSEFAAQAEAEGYSAAPNKTPRPFHGYYYRILTRQGNAAPGSARNYVVNGRMTDGFAMIAYPAEYGNSGIMTFLVGPDGMVYEADLGEDTRRTAAAIEEYDPDSRWYEVE
jgi:hypothetical protein